METTQHKQSARQGASQPLAPSPQPRAFTLVELLVVIAIIGILASLITAAAAGALKRARQAQIKTEVDQIHTALQTYLDTNGAFPPNCQVDDTNVAPGSNNSDDQIDESIVLSDLKTHIKRAFPQSREDENLLRALMGIPADTALPRASNYPQHLRGGMTSGEALVFWLGGFSSDPQYPISGEGGPAYPIPSINGTSNHELDPIESRNWVYPFDVARLRPRLATGYFDQGGNRYIEFTDINGQNRRINFWQYVTPRMTQPLLYFDTSRHAPADLVNGNLLARSDPPAATSLSGAELHVHAIKRRSESANASSPIQFATPDKFQILSAGVDDAWGDEAFERMSAHSVTNPEDWTSYLLFPDGPFTGDVADTIVNFSEATLEASQP